MHIAAIGKGLFVLFQRPWMIAEWPGSSGAVVELTAEVDDLHAGPFYSAMSLSSLRTQAKQPITSATAVIPRESGVSSTPGPIASIMNASGILDHPPEPVIRPARAGPVGG